MEDRNINISLKLSRRTLIWLIIFAIVVIFGVFDLKFNLIGKTISYFNRAEATITIMDKETKKPIATALVESGSVHAQTDSTGIATLSNLPSGNNGFTISKTGYDQASISAELQRGTNDLGVIRLSTKKNLATIKGKLADLVTKAPISKALVSIDDASANSDSTGVFQVVQVTMQKSQVKITIAGYLDYTKDIDVKDKQVDLGTIELTPRGKVIFTSDRDGTSSIYSANLDGTEAQKLLDNVSQYSDEGDGGMNSSNYSSSFWISPDSKHLAYTSNGEQDSSSDKPRNLYVASIKGQEPTKLSDDANPYNVNWLDNSKIVYTIYADSTAGTAAHVKVINIGGGEATQLDETISTATYAYFNIEVSTEGLVAYTVGYTGAEDKSGTYFVNADGSNRRKISDKQCSYDMTFAPDGATLFCSYYDNGTKKVQINTNTLAITDGTNPFSKSGTNVSSDGKKVLFVDSRDGQSNLFVKNVDGTGEKQLTQDGYVQSGKWSASGKLIAYISGKDGLFVKAIPLTGGDGIKITSCNGSSLALIDN